MLKKCLFVLLLLATTACQKEWAPKILVEVNAGNLSQFLKVSNQEDFSCKNIKIQVNNLYGGMLQELKAHEERLIALKDFKDEQGNSFNANTQVQQILVIAEKEDGTEGKISYGPTEE